MSTLENLRSLLKSKVKNADRITADSTIKDLGIDSLDLVDMMITLEEIYGVEFQDDDFLGIETIGDVVKRIDSKRS